MSGTVQRLRTAGTLLGLVVVGGTVGYLILGLSLLDALYQTITTITTVGFREVTEFGAVEKSFTIVVIVLGVGTVLYTFTAVVQFVVEGQLSELVGRRRMERKIAEMSDHVIVCGWGRVGRAVTDDLQRAGCDIVIIDGDAERLEGTLLPVIIGDATLDTTLRTAGIDRASALVVALAGDAANLFVTLSARAINPKLFIVARARVEDSVPKLVQAGADRVVNPQELGAARMSSFVVQPNVAEFVDVVMHERSMEFRMQEVALSEHSPLAGRSLRAANLRAHANVLVLAVREPDGTFMANPPSDHQLDPGDVIIAVGTTDDLQRLVAYCGT
ncbi:MAG: potassium channel family protein [Desertimonas sp.]